MTSISVSAFCQSDFPKTGSISLNAKDSAPMPKRRVLTEIYIDNPTDYLTGNPCVEGFANQMGVVFLPKYAFPPNDFGNLAIWLHNRGAGLKMLFSKGPFWKRNIKRRVRDCRRSGGDFRG